MLAELEIVGEDEPLLDDSLPSGELADQVEVFEDACAAMRECPP